MAGQSWLGSLYGLDTSADTAQNLSDQGFKQYVPGQAPDQSGKFAGVPAPSFAGAAPYEQAQTGLMTQLQQEANGQGPSLAGQELAAGTDAAAANAMGLAASTSRGGNPGAATGAATSAAAGATQTAAGQAAATRTQEQLNAQNQLEAIANAGVNQNLAQTNATTQAGEFNSQSLQNLAGLENQDWALGQNLMAQSQGQENQVIGQGVVNSQNAGNSATSGVIGGLLSSAGSILGMKEGGVVDGPIPALVGEAGKEVLVPLDEDEVPEEQFEDGGVVDDDSGIDSFVKQIQAHATDVMPVPVEQAPALQTPGTQAPTTQDQPQKASSGTAPVQGVSAGTEDAAIEQGFQQGVASIGKGIANSSPKNEVSSLMGSGGGSSGAASAAGGLGGDAGGADAGATAGMGDLGGGAALLALAAHGMVVDGPRKTVLGENGPEAVIPVDADGSVDMSRARDPGLRALLEEHPEVKARAKKIAKRKAA